MMKSFVKQAGYSIPICIIDNSTTTPLPRINSTQVTIIDNCNFKHTPNYNQASMNHCASLEYAMQQINTRYILLCDNDILFHPTISTLLSNDVNSYNAYGEIGYDIVPPNRLFPYFCIIDNTLKKQQHISYFDETRIVSYGRDASHMDIKYSKYDTGYSFLEDIQANGWLINKIKITDYAIHLKGASLHAKDITKWINKFSNLF